MNGKERPRIREMIQRLGLRPDVVNGVWDGFTAVDDGSGRMLDWLDRQGVAAKACNVRRTILSGSWESQMRRMAAEGQWGEVKVAKRT